jgi:hypothetical protein
LKARGAAMGCPVRVWSWSGDANNPELRVTKCSAAGASKSGKMPPFPLAWRFKICRYVIVFKGFFETA